MTVHPCTMRAGLLPLLLSAAPGSSGRFRFALQYRCGRLSALCCAVTDDGDCCKIDCVVIDYRHLLCRTDDCCWALSDCCYWFERVATCVWNTNQYDVRCCISSLDRSSDCYIVDLWLWFYNDNISCNVSYMIWLYQIWSDMIDCEQIYDTHQISCVISVIKIVLRLYMLICAP